MWGHLLRAVHRRLSPDARNALRTWLVLESRDRMPEAIERFDEARVLVVAPHSDDEVIGCGGVIARHVRSGSKVDVVFMTDGAWGDSSLHDRGLSHAQRAHRRADLVVTRKREASEAGNVLGSHRLHFLDRPDSALRPDDATVAALAALLAALRPILVYLPFVYDLHEDHWQTNIVFAAAASRLDRADTRSMRVRGYEVWTPLLANRVADITDLMPLKLQALRMFESQLRDQDYRHTVEGLNAFRSNGVFAGKGYAEAFHELPLASYLRLVRAATLRDSPVLPGAGARVAATVSAG